LEERRQILKKEQEWYDKGNGETNKKKRSLAFIYQQPQIQEQVIGTLRSEIMTL